MKSFDVFLDDRDSYKPGFKFNEWELRGVPLRIEIGPKDVEKNSVVIARRDNGEKEVVAFSKVKERVEKLLDEIQNGMLHRAEKILKEAVVEVGNLGALKEAIEKKKIALAPLCGSRKCEDSLKFETGGAKVLNIPSEQSKNLGKCVVCGKKADYVAYCGKSY